MRLYGHREEAFLQEGCGVGLREKSAHKLLTPCISRKELGKQVALPGDTFTRTPPRVRQLPFAYQAKSRRVSVQRQAYAASWMMACAFIDHSISAPAGCVKAVRFSAACYYASLPDALSASFMERAHALTVAR